MLLALPLPKLISLQTPWRTKVRLYTLCALGLFIIAITIIRLPINALHASVQANRTTWASTELLTAAIAVNAPTLFGAVNRWRRRSKNELSSSKSRKDGFSSTRTVGSCVRPKHSHDVLCDIDDDEGLMLSAQCQASVSSEGAVTEYQVQEGMIMKTFEVSHSRFDKFGVAKPDRKT